MKNSLRKKSFFRWIVYSLIGISLSYCHADIETGNNKEVNANAAEVTSFPVKRRRNTLANWKMFEVNHEVIITPPGWTAQLSAPNLTLVPPDNTDKNERLIFTRLTKDSPDFDYDKLGQNLANLAFKDFVMAHGDTLKKVEFQKDFCYERNSALSKNGVDYTGYFLVYINDSSIYEFNIVLASKRINSYRGSLMKDIIGNIQINNKYISSEENPLKNVVYIKEE